MASPDTVWIILSVTTFWLSTEAASTVESGSASCQISLVPSLTAAVEAIRAAVLAVVPTKIWPSPADGEAEAEADGLTLAEGELETELDGDTEAEGELERDELGESDADGLELADGELDSEALAEGDTEAEGLLLTLELGLTELEGLSEPEGLKLVEPDGEVECDGEVEELGLKDKLELGEIDELGDTEAEGELDSELEGLIEADGDELTELEGDTEALDKLLVTRPNNLTKTAPVTVNKVAVPIAPAPDAPVKVIVLTAWIDQSVLVTGAAFWFVWTIGIFISYFCLFLLATVYHIL